MNQPIQAIETSYGRYRFRSRTEARWAVFFDHLGWEYEYEKQGFDLGNYKYLPDFWIQEFNCWMEIKGPNFTEHEINKCALLSAQSDSKVLLATGTPEFDRFQIMLFIPSLAALWRQHPEYEIFPFVGNNFSGAATWMKFENYTSIKRGKSFGLIFSEGNNGYNLSSKAFDIESACLAATRARFEHGECG